jgi:hypothetical protein
MPTFTCIFLESFTSVLFLKLNIHISLNILSSFYYPLSPPAAHFNAFFIMLEPLSANLYRNLGL